MFIFQILSVKSGEQLSRVDSVLLMLVLCLSIAFFFPGNVYIHLLSCHTICDWQIFLLVLFWCLCMSFNSLDGQGFIRFSTLCVTKVPLELICSLFIKMNHFFYYLSCKAFSQLHTCYAY